MAGIHVPIRPHASYLSEPVEPDAEANEAIRSKLVFHTTDPVAPYYQDQDHEAWVADGSPPVARRVAQPDGRPEATLTCFAEDEFVPRQWHIETHEVWSVNSLLVVREKGGTPLSLLPSCFGLHPVGWLGDVMAQGLLGALGRDATLAFRLQPGEGIALTVVNLHRNEPSHFRAELEGHTPYRCTLHDDCRAHPELGRACRAARLESR